MTEDVVVTPAHSDAEEAELQALYAQLEPDARMVYVNFFLARTPAHLQEDMKNVVEENFPNPPDPPPPEDPSVLAQRGERDGTEYPTAPPDPVLTPAAEVESFNATETKPVAPL